MEEGAVACCIALQERHPIWCLCRVCIALCTCFALLLCRNGGGVTKAAEELARGAAREALGPLLDAACARLGAVVKRAYDIAAEQTQLQRGAGKLQRAGQLVQDLREVPVNAACEADGMAAHRPSPHAATLALSFNPLLAPCRAPAAAPVCGLPRRAVLGLPGLCGGVGGSVQGHRAAPPGDRHQRVCHPAACRWGT